MDADTIFDVIMLFFLFFATIAFGSISLVLAYFAFAFVFLGNPIT